MKLKYFLYQLLLEVRWVRPNQNELKREYHVEYELKSLSSTGIFKDLDDFLEKVKNAKIVEVTPELDNKIRYRVQTQDKDSLLSLIKSYKSYHEFRNEKTLDDLYSRIQNDKTVFMPIVLKYPNGDMRVFSGNTRMNISFQLNINPKVLMIEI